MFLSLHPVEWSDLVIYTNDLVLSQSGHANLTSFAGARTGSECIGIKEALEACSFSLAILDAELCICQ